MIKTPHFHLRGHRFDQPDQGTEILHAERGQNNFFLKVLTENAEQEVGGGGIMEHGL